jgi:hypothetical protein
VLTLTEAGFYCEAGGFHVDPWRPVARAVVTHAHGDHVAWGCGAYLTSEEGTRVLAARLPPGATVEPLPFGQGSRAGLFTDYTLGVWAGDRLVPIARAHSGLTENETRRVDAFVRRHTIERFGPVRTVKPELVFELTFEGIQPSSRHKSGIAMHMPRVTRWRTDKRSDEADTLEAVRRLVDTRDR